MLMLMPDAEIESFGSICESLGDPGLAWGCHGPVFGRFRKKTAAVNQHSYIYVFMYSADASANADDDAEAEKLKQVCIDLCHADADADAENVQEYSLGMIFGSLGLQK